MLLQFDDGKKEKKNLCHTFVISHVTLVLQAFSCFKVRWSLCTLHLRVRQIQRYCHSSQQVNHVTLVCDSISFYYLCYGWIIIQQHYLRLKIVNKSMQVFYHEKTFFHLIQSNISFIDAYIHVYIKPLVACAAPARTHLSRQELILSQMKASQAVA